MSKYDDVELAIMQELKIYESEAKINNYTSNRDWTHYLKVKLATLGKERFDCRVCTSGFNGEHDSEWLYDLVWYKEEGSGDDSKLIDVPLVVESEWNPYLNAMKFDFEKLLVVNASHRLFVGYVHSNNLQTRLDYFKGAVEKYLHGSAGDRFMIALLDMDTKVFSYNLIIRQKKRK